MRSQIKEDFESKYQGKSKNFENLWRQDAKAIINLAISLNQIDKIKEYGAIGKSYNIL